MADIDIREFDTGAQAARQAADFLVAKLRHYSAKNSLLLLSGGSSVRVPYWAASDLDINVTNRIIVGQVDERYGPVGHADSNWVRMESTGMEPSIFRSTFQMLQSGISAVDIAADYGRKLQHLIDETEYRVAVCGIGENNSLSGIYPMEEEQRFSDLFLGDNLVVNYPTRDYERITLAARAFLQLDEIIVFMEGKEKQQAVENLRRAAPLHEQPAQLLKSTKRATVFYGREAAQ